MRNVTDTFSKNQYKAICFLLLKCEKRYPDKYSSVLALLKKAGFLALKEGNKYKIIADPDYKEVDNEN